MLISFVWNVWREQYGSNEKLEGTWRGRIKRDITFLLSMLGEQQRSEEVLEEIHKNDAFLFHVTKSI